MKLKKIVDSMKDDIIKATQELVRIRSIEGNPEHGAPFGTEIRQ